MKKIIKFLEEVGGELKKVTWPTRENTLKLTLIVLLISGIIALYVGVLDIGFTKLLELIITK